MAPTSDERREVAARLRNDGRALDAIDAPLELASLTLDDALGIDHMRSWCDVFERLADLIYPTCYDTLPDDWGPFECSECGTQWSVCPVYIGTDGTSEHDEVKPSFCPGCGARVVEGGEG